jgi:citrate lyase gamma subunit
MGTVNFSIPDDVKDAFNTVFDGQNKSAIVTQLMREAIERAELKERSRAAITRILQARPKAPVRSAKTLRAARERGRS